MIKNFKNLLHYAKFSFKNVICSRKKHMLGGRVFGRCTVSREIKADSIVKYRAEVSKRYLTGIKNFARS